MCVLPCCWILYQDALRLARQLVGLLEITSLRHAGARREVALQQEMAGTDNTVLPIKVADLRVRKEQFLRAHASKQSELRKHRMALNFDRFLQTMSVCFGPGLDASYGPGCSRLVVLS